MIDRKRVVKPVSVVCGKEPNNALPAEKSVKAMTLNAEYRSPKDYNNRDTQNRKKYNSVHLFSILLPFDSFKSIQTVPI